MGGVLIEAGVAFRLFLWLVPLGLVIAAATSFWSNHDPGALEHESRRFGISAVAAHAGARALEAGDRSIALVLAFGLVTLVWFSFGAIRALVLAHALAWETEPPKLRRPVAALALFNVLFLVAVVSSSGVVWLRAVLGGGALAGTFVSGLLTGAVALWCMWLLPHGGSRLRDLLPGAVLVAVGYQLVYIAVLVYFAPRLGRAEETYGALGTAATTLVWLYVLARLAIGAAFLNAVLHRRRLTVPR
jgi:uncharacterized BrkB/YihY/UPF0761 family membrane protein